jgi:predicted nuclease with RNAse H fold
VTIKERQLRVVQLVYSRWAAANSRVTPDPAYARDGKSQYPEGIVALSAPVSAQDDFTRQVEEELARQGLPPLVTIPEV